MSKTTYKFNGKKFGDALYKRISEEQTTRLIEYAQEEIIKIVETREFKDRTRNLADSYIWCVFFNGVRKGFGTYGRKSARSKSFLHEYSFDMRKKVDGRRIARDFSNSYKPSVKKGWEIVFAACAPYGAYLEAGFTFHGKYIQFDVMSQRYDHIKGVLSPLCHVVFEVNPPKY